MRGIFFKKTKKHRTEDRKGKKWNNKNERKMNWLFKKKMSNYFLTLKYQLCYFRWKKNERERERKKEKEIKNKIFEILASNLG